MHRILVCILVIIVKRDVRFVRGALMILYALVFLTYVPITIEIDLVTFFFFFLYYYLYTRLFFSGR